MDTLSGKCIEEYREGCHKGLTFTGRHLRDASPLFLVGLYAAVQSNTTDDLHVIVDHIPGDLVATCHPMIVVHGLVAVYCHEIVIDCKLTVEIVGRHLHVTFHKPAGSGLHDCECLGQDDIEFLFYCLILVFNEFV